MKIARVTTIPEAYVHIRKQISDLVMAGHEVTLITSAGDYQKVLQEESNVKIITIKFSREISIFNDLKTLFLLWAHFLFNRYDIVHSTTPKAGLLTAFASFLSLHSVRLHTFTGQRWATLKGFKRELLKKLDRLIYQLNTHCFTDSPSQIKFLQDEGVVSNHKISCLHLGCLGGIDFERFDYKSAKFIKESVRAELSIPKDSFVLIFVGRMTEDKGLLEMLKSFDSLQKEYSDLYLLLVGGCEFFTTELKNEFTRMSSKENVKYLGFQNVPEKYYASADVFCMPSYREGFGTVILEAAGMGLPSVATRIPGLIDAVEDNKSGVLIPPKEITAFSNAVVSLISNPELLENMSNYAYLRAKNNFSHEIISTELMGKYEELLGK